MNSWLVARGLVNLLNLLNPLNLSNPSNPLRSACLLLVLLIVAAAGVARAAFPHQAGGIGVATLLQVGLDERSLSGR